MTRRYVGWGYLALIVTLLCTAPTLVMAAVFIGPPNSRAPHIDINQLRKQYPVKVIHGVENFVIGDMLFRTATVQARNGFVGVRWPGGIAVFQFDSSAQPYESTFFQACATWTALANVSCRLRSAGDVNYFTVYAGSGNYSNIGMQIGQTVIYNWTVPGIIEHEIAHVFGFIHEQSRADRDAYVQINAPNIEPDQLHNFDIYADSISFGPYDYGSIMEYGVCDFSVNPNCTYIPNDPNEPAERKTIVPTACNSPFEGEMGQRNSPSYYDGVGMRQIYGPAIPLAIFKSGRNRSCGVEKLGPIAMSKYCTPSTDGCGAAVLASTRSETFFGSRDYCDNTFQAVVSCSTNKQMFSHVNNSGGECGIGGIFGLNHVQHESWQCSCVTTDVAALCRNDANGSLSDTILNYSRSRSSVEQAVARFATSFQKAATAGRLAPDASQSLSRFIMLGYPSRHYLNHLIRARQLIDRRIMMKRAKPVSAHELEVILSNK